MYLCGCFYFHRIKWTYKRHRGCKLRIWLSQWRCWLIKILSRISLVNRKRLRGHKLPWPHIPKSHKLLSVNFLFQQYTKIFIIHLNLIVSRLLVRRNIYSEISHLEWISKQIFLLRNPLASTDGIYLSFNGNWPNLLGNTITIHWWVKCYHTNLC